MDKINKLIELVKKLYNDKFYGEVTFKFEAGIPKIAVKIKENIVF